MGDRFYLQQLESTGSCPGRTTKRRRKVAWDDEKKQQAIDLYTKQDPTPENSMEIVAEIAEELEETPNGVRMILSKAGVYVKKSPGAGGTKSSNGGGGGRVSKADSQAALTKAIVDVGGEVDEEIISKLTGKACLYLEKVISSINS